MHLGFVSILRSTLISCPTHLVGGIGRNMKKKCDAFGMKTIYHNRNPLSEELAGGAKYVSFNELLSQSDVLSLNVPLNVRPIYLLPAVLSSVHTEIFLQKHTRHMISTAEFSKMKDGIVIVNTARGAIMDEHALVKALDSGKVWSCGLDVYDEEPKVHPGLIANSHVMLLPHMGTWAVETQTAMELECIANVWSALEKGRLVNPVPEQADL